MTLFSQDRAATLIQRVRAMARKSRMFFGTLTAEDSNLLFFYV